MCYRGQAVDRNDTPATLIILRSGTFASMRASPSNASGWFALAD
jgi:hypothetical protein